jgi:SAM-dependent methyltransferase
MLTHLAHRVVSNPRVYDLVQAAAGANYLRRELARRLPTLRPGALVLDIGGGTGAIRALLPADCVYICLDSDPVKLAGFKRQLPDEIGMLADATSMPILSGSVDAVLAINMSHHIPEDVLNDLFDESRRVLKPDGSMIFMDAIWNPRRPLARLLWRFDRGAFPRSPRTLDAALGARFSGRTRTPLAYWHQYLLWIGSPVASGG